MTGSTTGSTISDETQGAASASASAGAGAGAGAGVGAGAGAVQSGALSLSDMLVSNIGRSKSVSQSEVR